jgi:hypothetical protein
MTSITEEAGNAPATATGAQPKTQQEGPCCATSRPRCAHQGQGDQEGQPGQESAQGREESHRRPRRQQDRQGPRPAQAAGWRHSQGADEGYRLAAAFGPRVLVRDRRQEDGVGRDFHQRRGWGAQLLRQSLKLPRPYQPPGTVPAAFLVWSA